MQTQHTTNATIDTLEVLYWEARDNNNDALAKAVGLALDAAIEVKDNAPAHGIPRPRLALAWCQWCRTIDCCCM